MSSRAVAQLLRAIADVIERSSSSEIEALTKGLSGPVGAKGKKRGADKGGKEIRAPDIALITHNILESTDRSSAKSILEDAGLSRRELVELGQEYNIHIVKADTVEVIETKIVEALVGSRLSSKAIRGEQ